MAWLVLATCSAKASNSTLIFVPESDNQLNIRPMQFRIQILNET
jgi:hypothetical protein